MSPHNVLILPGWQNSEAAHWQSRWEHLYGYRRVEQHDWMRPLRGDWMAQLEDVVLSLDIENGGAAVLVAHSLGCILVSAWVSHSRHAHRVKAALLVAPPDTERDDVRQILPGWSPVPYQKLPFKSCVMAGSDDPYCDAARSRLFAEAWGASWIDAGPRGHLNAGSGLGDWPQAHAELATLMAL